MLLAEVIGNVWSTKKLDSISALRLLFIQPLGKDLKPDGNVLVAADEVGAGFGEMVIITRGAPAMQAFDKENSCGRCCWRRRCRVSNPCEAAV